MSKKKRRKKEKKRGGGGKWLIVEALYSDLKDLKQSKSDGFIFIYF